MFGLNAGNAPDELRAAALAMRKANSDIRKDVGTRMRSTMNPVWRSEIESRSPGGMAGRMLGANARIAAGNPPQIVSAASKRSFGNGLMPDKHWAGYEYGANRNKYWQTSSSKGKSYKRRVNRHLPAKGKGRVLEPAAKEVLPRIASFWVQSVIKSFMDAAEGKE